MNVAVDKLLPGMVLKEDIIAKTGKPIIQKDTKLTEQHIEFIDKFLINTVSIIPPKRDDVKINFTKTEQQIKKESLFVEKYDEVVVQYKKMFASWQNNVPVSMFEVRNCFIPIFNEMNKENSKILLNSFKKKSNDFFYYRSVAISLLAVYLAKQLNYEKKDWIQLGLAAVLSDCGIAKIVNRDEYSKHPVHSFNMVKDERTLTKSAKLAILNHHERLDGSGYPLNLKDKSIHLYARIIAVCDSYITQLEHDTEPTIVMQLNQQKGKTLDATITQLLLDELTAPKSLLN